MNLTLTVFRRLSLYLQFLKQLPPDVTRISATAVAQELGLGEVLVRKELSQASGAVGKPKTGYDVPTLIDALEGFLGYHTMSRAVVVGAGGLGRSLMKNADLPNFGFHITAGFDINPEVVGRLVGGHPVLPVSELREYCKNHEIRIAILTAPKDVAQELCDLLVSAGVVAIWTFAPIALKTPPHVKLHYENFSASIAVLTHYLQETDKNSKNT